MDVLLIAPGEISLNDTLIEFEKVGTSYVDQVRNNPVNSLFIKRIQENLGIGSIAAYLRERKVETRIINASVEGLSNEEIADIIMLESPHIVGFSLLYDLHVFNTLEIIILIRKRGFTNHITLGGTFISLAYERFLEAFDFIDTIIIGEGEEPFFHLYSNLKYNRPLDEIKGLAWVDENKALRYEKRLKSVEELKFPPAHRDTLKYLKDNRIKVSTATIYGSRGCNNACVYCAAPAMRINHNKQWRPRNINALVEEIESLKNNYQISYFYFCDDNFCGYGEEGKKHIEQFTQRMFERNLSVKFHAELRADCHLTEQDILELKKAGLDEALIGIESGAQSSLDRWRKSVKVEDNIRMINHLKKYGVKIAPAFIIIDAYTSLEELRVSTKFIEENELYKMDDPWFLFNQMIVYPGTLLEKKLMEDGVVHYPHIEKHNIDSFASRNELFDFCAHISIIKYEITSPVVRVLWMNLVAVVNEIIYYVNTVLPQVIYKYKEKKGNKNLTAIIGIRKWRGSIGEHCLNLLKYSIEWAEKNETSPEIKVQDLNFMLRKLRQEYDTLYLGNSINVLKLKTGWELSNEDIIN